MHSNASGVSVCELSATHHRHNVRSASQCSIAPCSLNLQPTPRLKTLTSHKNLTKITTLRKGIPYRIRIHTHTGTPAMRRRCQRRRRHSVAERRRPDRMLSSPMLCAVLCTRFVPVLHWLLRARPIRSRTRCRPRHCRPRCHHFLLGLASIDVSSGPSCTATI